MSMVSEIQVGAADGAQSLAAVLRKTLILAYRLKHDGLKEWVQRELDGYGADDELPEYRLRRCQSFAHLRNPYIGEWPNAGVITSGQPDYVKEFIERPVRFAQGIAALESLAHGTGDLQELWPTDLTVRHADHGYDGFEALRAWKLIPKSVAVGVADAIRNRLLVFVLELEAAAPSVGHDSAVANVAPSVVTQVFNTYVIGNHNRVQGTSTAVVAPPPVPAGDDGALARTLVSLGVPSDKADELAKSAKGTTPVTERTMGAKLKKLLGGAGTGAAEVVKGVATDLIIAALKQYWGLPS